MTSTRVSNGGLIDRTRPLRFAFDGKAYEVSQAIPLPPRCWQTVCACWAAASSITAAKRLGCLGG